MSDLLTTTFPWVPLHAGHFWGLWIADRVFQYQVTMRGFVQEHLQRNVTLDLPPYSMQSTHMELLTMFRAIESNLHKLTGGLPIHDMEPTRFWQGGTLDNPRFDYRDVNRWFRTIQLLRQYMLEMQVRITNSFIIGYSFAHQASRITRRW